MKLDHYGVRNNTLSWIEDFLSDRTQIVVLEGNSSSTNPVASGVPQELRWAMNQISMK
jgi:hypothetical protein